MNKLDLKNFNKNILLITSTNLACNPRCLKELRLLIALQAKVTVLAFNLHNWSTSKEVTLNKEFTAVTFHYLETTKKDFYNWVVSSVIEKMAGLFSKLLPQSVFWASLAVSKRSWLLLQWLKKTNCNPDFIIAHNPPAFYPAYWFANKKNIPFAIDVEDYHPGENLPKSVKNGVTTLMKSLLPKAKYISFASPLIMNESIRLVGPAIKSSIVVNNFFSEKDFVNIPIEFYEKLQLIWFSQNIDFNRGLEEMLDVLTDYEDEIALTVIGNPKQLFCDKYLYNKKNIEIINSLPALELIKMMNKFDVGLALEPGKDLNNDIALSNKILIYFQAGLYILASNTTAQEKFLNNHPSHGIITSLKKHELKKTLDFLIEKKNEIRDTKNERFKNSSAFNWEYESMGLVKQWVTILR